MTRHVKKCINMTQFLCQYNTSFFTVYNSIILVLTYGISLKSVTSFKCSCSPRTLSRLRWLSYQLFRLILSVDGLHCSTGGIVRLIVSDLWMAIDFQWEKSLHWATQNCGMFPSAGFLDNSAPYFSILPCNRVLHLTQLPKSSRMVIIVNNNDIPSRYW